MVRRRITAIAAAAAVLLALLSGSSAASLPSATLTCSDTVAPGALLAARLHLEGDGLSGVSFDLQYSDALTIVSCYQLSAGWTLTYRDDYPERRSGRVAVYCSDGRSALDVMMAAGQVVPGRPVTLIVSNLAATDGSTETELGRRTWQAAFVSDPLDLNGDGNLDASDLQCLFTYLSTGSIVGSLQSVPQQFIASADVNGDGAVNILDYQALYDRLSQ